MRDFFYLSWALYVIGMTVYGWFTVVESFEGFIASVFIGAFLLILPEVLFPNER